MNEEEKKAVEHLKETSKDRMIIPLDDEILIAVNLIEKLQKENEELKNKCEISKIGSDYWCMKYAEFQKENEELKIKNNAIKRESEAYAENMIRLDNELNLEKEKSKYEWIRQNCLPQELVNKLYIPIQKVKDKIEELKQEKKKYGNCLIEMYEDELVNRDIKILQELLEKNKIK